MEWKARIVNYREGSLATIRLTSGEYVMLSVSQGGISLSRMRLGCLIQGPKIAEWLPNDLDRFVQKFGRGGDESPFRATVDFIMGFPDIKSLLSYITEKPSTNTSTDFVQKTLGDSESDKFPTERMLGDAIRMGKLSIVKKFIENNPPSNFNVPCFKGLPPLHLAASLGHNDIVDYLLQNYPTIDLFGRDANGHLAVYCADSADKFEVACNLIKQHEAKWKSPDTSTKFLLREEAYIISRMFGHFLGYIANEWQIKDAQKLFINKRAIYAAFSIEINTYIGKSLSQYEKKTFNLLEECALHIADFQHIEPADMELIERMGGNTRTAITATLMKLSGSERVNCGYGQLLTKYLSRSYEESNQMLTDQFPFLFSPID